MHSAGKKFTGVVWQTRLLALGRFLFRQTCQITVGHENGIYNSSSTDGAKNNANERLI